MENITHTLDRLRSLNALGFAVSREFNDSHDQEIYKFINSIIDDDPMMVDFLLLGSCCLIHDYWVIMSANHGYMSCMDQDLISVIIKTITYYSRKLHEKLLGFDQNNVIKFKALPIKKTYCDYEALLFQNELILELSNYLNNIEAPFAASIVLSAAAEFFSNCGFIDHKSIFEKWFYSANLSEVCSIIHEGNMPRAELSKYCLDNLPRFKYEIIDGIVLESTERALVVNRDHVAPYK